jgi:hypothetical protein
MVRSVELIARIISVMIEGSLSQVAGFRIDARAGCFRIVKATEK